MVRKHDALYCLRYYRSSYMLDMRVAQYPSYMFFDLPTEPGSMASYLWLPRSAFASPNFQAWVDVVTEVLVQVLLKVPESKERLTTALVCTFKRPGEQSVRGMWRKHMRFHLLPAVKCL